MREEDYIVSMTDTTGRITYGNRIFIEFSGYSESELLGSQHNIIRHPDMPRGVFKLLWDKISNREECFAYVKNCLLYTSPSPRDGLLSRMPSSA